MIEASSDSDRPLLPLVRLLRYLELHPHGPTGLVEIWIIRLLIKQLSTTTIISENLAFISAACLLEGAAFHKLHRGHHKNYANYLQIRPHSLVRQVIARILECRCTSTKMKNKSEYAVVFTFPFCVDSKCSCLSQFKMHSDKLDLICNKICIESSASTLEIFFNWLT